MVVVSWEQAIFAIAEDMPRVSIADISCFFFSFLLSRTLPLHVTERGISVLQRSALQ